MGTTSNLPWLVLLLFSLFIKQPAYAQSKQSEPARATADELAAATAKTPKDTPANATANTTSGAPADATAKSPKDTPANASANTTSGAPAADSDSDPLAGQWRYRNLLGFTLNVIGLENRLEVGYRKPLFEESSMLLQGNNVGVYVLPYVSPASATIGAALEFKPLAVFQLRLEYRHVWYFGNFNFVQSFANPAAEHSDTRRRQRGEQQLHYSTSGQHFVVVPQLQAAVGPVAVRNTLRMEYLEYNLRDDDPVFFETRFDMLAPGDGWALINHLDVLYLTDFGLAAGLRYSLTHVSYANNPFAETREPLNSPTHRVGPLVAYQLFNRDGKHWLNKPTIIAMTNWWIRHRYRTGADVSQMWPFFSVALSFQGDLTASQL